MQTIHSNIEIIQYGADFAYILKNDALYAPTEYKILRNSNSDCFVNCVESFYNGFRQFLYFTDNLRPFSELIPNMGEKNLHVVAANIINDVLEIKKIGFLSCRNIDASFDHIFIDTRTFKAFLIYLPVRTGFFKDNIQFENELRSELAKVFISKKSFLSFEAEMLLSNLQNGMMSFENLLKKDVESQAALFEKSPVRKTILQIQSTNWQPSIVFEINKGEFIIGRSVDYADGVIPNNKQIGRIHCKIRKENGTYFLEDMKSVNGTYINRRRMAAHESVAIKDGDIITLANMEFLVKNG